MKKFHSERALRVWEPYHKLALKLVSSHPNYRIFVATDSEELHQVAKDAFGDRLLYVEGPIDEYGTLRSSQKENEPSNLSPSPQ